MARGCCLLLLLPGVLLLGGQHADALLPPLPQPKKTVAAPAIAPAPSAPSSSTTTTTLCDAPLAPPPPEHGPHKDSALDRFLIGLLATKLADMTGALPWRAEELSFAEFAQSTKALLVTVPGVVDTGLHGDAHLLRRSQQIADTLSGLVPPFLRALFRLTGKSRLACELHALLAPLVSGWLVGPAKRVEGEIEWVGGGSPGKGEGRRREVWTSSTKIERCRYLAESGCRKSCVYLCKVPTQQFFAETLGTPLTLTPDLEDGSCVMAFGQVPLPLDQDPVVQATRALGSCCGGGGNVGGPGGGARGAGAGKPHPPSSLGRSDEG